jgi:homocitrate synthase NifV
MNRKTNKDSGRGVNDMKFIDRSLPEFLKINMYAEKKKMVEFAELLYKLGIEIFEIDRSCLKYINRFPKNLEYIYRLDKEADLEIIPINKIDAIVVSVKDYSYEKQYMLMREIINKYKKKIILEVSAQDIKDIERYFDFPEGNLLFHADVLRILGFSSCITENLKNFIENTKKTYDIEIDICAENNYFCATGVAVNLVTDDIDYVTGTFGGLGGEVGYAALEEVLLAAVIINHIDFMGNTDILPQIKLVVEELCGSITPKDKPIIGKDIFLCMSGIHVDGIMKNPSNYEPFEPELVGLKRRIVLGKHSGRGAVEWILNQSNIEYDKKDLPRILQFIQEKSIELKSYFDGEDLRKLVNEFKVS